MSDRRTPASLLINKAVKRRRAAKLYFSVTHCHSLLLLLLRTYTKARKSCKHKCRTTTAVDTLKDLFLCVLRRQRDFLFYDLTLMMKATTTTTKLLKFKQESGAHVDTQGLDVLCSTTISYFNYAEET